MTKKSSSSLAALLAVFMSSFLTASAKDAPCSPYQVLNEYDCHKISSAKDIGTVPSDCRAIKICCLLNKVEIVSLAQAVPGLECLDLEGIDVGKELLDAFAVATLKALNISRARKLKVSEMHSVLPKLTGLRALYANSCILDDKCITLLSGLSQLEELDLVCNPSITDRYMPSLCRLPNLKAILVGNLPPSDSSMTGSWINEAKWSGTVEWIELWHLGAMDDKGFHHLRELSRLRVLKISGHVCASKSALSALSELTQLEQFAVPQVLLDPDAIKESRWLASLKILSVEGKRDSDIVLSQDVLRQMSNLQTLQVCLGRATDSFVSNVVCLPSPCNLILVSVQNLVERLPRIIAIQSLESISFNNCAGVEADVIKTVLDGALTPQVLCNGKEINPRK